MRNYSIDLAALSSVLLLAGCGNLSIPTGLSEDRYLDPNGVMVVATNLQGATFDANERWVELKVDQSRLAQLHSVPQYMWQSGSGISFFWKESQAKPLNVFEWEPITKSNLSIRAALIDVSIVSPHGMPLEVPVRLSSDKVELDLNNVIDKIRPNVTYEISCTRCKPNLTKLLSQYSEIPPPPQVKTVASFVLSSSEYASIKRRVQEINAASARLERERKQAERKRQQELAQENRTREAEIRKVEADRKREAARVAREGDGSSDDLLCKKYGFKPNTQAYANCRLQVDLAKREMQQQQAQYMAQQQQLQEAQAAERKRRQGAFMLGMGLSMMGGQNAAASSGTNTYQQPPPPSTRTYTLPNGRIMTCTTTGTMTNCF